MLDLEHGGISETMLDLETVLRNIGPYYANPGQNNMKYMRFRGQPGGIQRNLADFKGKCQEKPRRSIEIWCRAKKILRNTRWARDPDH